MKNIKLYFFLISIFLLMFICNNFVPIFADDFGNSMVNGHRLSSLAEVINRAVNDYFLWSGRFITNIFVFLFLFFDKYIFDIINSLAFMATGIIIYVIAILKGKYDYSKIKIFPLAVIYSMIWFSCGCFGEVYFWITGATVYFWAVLLSLILVSLIVRNIYDATHSNNSLLMFILGVIVGNLLENLSAIIIFVIFAIIVWDIKNKQPEKWKIWMGLGLLIGFIALIGAPGNYVRAEYVDESYRLQKYIGTMKSVAKDQWALWLLAIIQFAYIKKKALAYTINAKLGCIFIIMGMGMNFIMLIPPAFPYRTSFPSAIYLIVGIVCLIYENNNFIGVLKNNIAHYILLIFVVCSVISYGNVLVQYKQLCVENIQREEYIYSEKAKGTMDIQVAPFTVSENRHIFVRDIRHDSEHWINRSTANYYGINSIVLK